MTSSRFVRTVEAADPVFSYPQAAEYLGISSWTLRRLVAQAKIESIQLSARRIGFKLSALQKHLNQNVRGVA